MHTDLSNLAARDDATLAADLAGARARFAVARVNDPRRCTEGYREAKYAVDVLSAELRRREALVAQQAEDIANGDVCTDRACLDATSHHSLCDCRCGGAGHSTGDAPVVARARVAVSARTVGGFSPSMLALLDADAAF